MSEETASTEPVEPAVPPPEPAPPPPEPAPAPEPAPEPEPKPANGGDTVPKGVFLNRVQQLASARDEAAERARAAEARAAEYEAMIARLQARPAADPAKPAETTTPPARQPARPPQDFDAAVNARAEQLRLAQERDAIIHKGYAEFGRQAFDETARLLQSFGCVSDDFIADVLAVDRENAHTVLTTIARDPDRAMALAALSPRQRIMELTRMTAPVPKATPAVAPTNPISRAPVPAPVPRATAPAPEIDPATPEGDAKMTDAEWERWFKREGSKRLKMFA